MRLRKISILFITIIVILACFAFYGCKKGNADNSESSSGSSSGSIAVPTLSIVGAPTDTVIFNDYNNQFKLSCAVDGDYEVVWNSSDEKVLTVKNGLVKILSEGSAVVTASLKDRDASDSVTINTKLLGLKINGFPENEVELGEDLPLLTASVVSNGTEEFDVVWKSSEPSVATIDDNGKITIISAGTTVIKAEKSDDDKVFDIKTLCVKDTIEEITPMLTESTIPVINGEDKGNLFRRDEKVYKIVSEFKRKHTAKINTEISVVKGKSYYFYFGMRQNCEMVNTAALTDSISASISSGDEFIVKDKALSEISTVSDYSSLFANTSVKLLNKIEFTAEESFNDLVLRLDVTNAFTKLDLEISNVICVEKSENSDSVVKFNAPWYPYNNYTNAWITDDADYLTGDAKYAIVVNKYKDANEDKSLKDMTFDYSTGISVKSGSSYRISYDIVVSDDYPLGTYNGSTFTKADNKIFTGITKLYGYLGSDGKSGETSDGDGFSLAELVRGGRATKISTNGKTVYHISIEATATVDMGDLVFTFFFYNNRSGTMGLCNFEVEEFTTNKIDPVYTESNIPVINGKDSGNVYCATSDKVYKIKAEEGGEYKSEIYTTVDLVKGKNYVLYYCLRQASELGNAADFTGAISVSLRNGDNYIVQGKTVGETSYATNFSGLYSNTAVKLFNKIKFTANSDVSGLIIEIKTKDLFTKLDIEISDLVCAEISAESDGVVKFNSTLYPYGNYTNSWVTDNANYLTGEAKYALIVNRYKDANQDNTIKDSRLNFSTGVGITAGKNYTITYDLVVNNDHPLGTYNGTTFTKKDTDIYAGVVGLYGYLGSNGSSTNQKGSYSLADMCNIGMATKTVDGNKTVYSITVDVVAPKDMSDLVFTFLFNANRSGTMSLCNFKVSERA